MNRQYKKSSQRSSTFREMKIMFAKVIPAKVRPKATKIIHFYKHGNHFKKMEYQFSKVHFIFVKVMTEQNRPVKKENLSWKPFPYS